ncbi:uncharacterized protein LOC142108472 [Mixophyes fleayi]|uniref:uncharacterized protein LOC142108472 n=1 Tax=Mixophyes fleayi TaxID=3061075 RepID=UPI003F4D97BF
MLQKLTPPGGYHCVLPPIMSAEEESRIVNAALATYKGQYEVTIPYIEVVKTDPTLPFRPRNREQAEQMARLLKERNTALEKASKDCAARKARFLAQQAERAQAVRDRMLRDHQKEQKVVIKKQKHLKSKPNINITQTSQPPLNWMRYRDMLDDLNKRRVSLEPEMRQKRIDEFKWQKVQSGIHWPGYEPSQNKPVGKLTLIAVKAEKVDNIKK